MTTQGTRVAVVGLGIMGSGMAANLLAAGFPLTVYNRTAAKTERFAELGAAVADSPAAAAAGADVVLVCVSDTPDVAAVLLGPDGVRAGIAPGALVVDCSTISPAATRDFAEQMASQGVGFVDAPVSGGSEGAVNGTLSIMVGGSADDVERARPVLEAIGRTITHVGPVGAGQTCKLVNQVLVVGNMLAVAEALLLAEAGGLDPSTAIQAVQGGAGGSWMLTNRGPQVVADDWRPGFTVDLQEKDLRLVLEAADQLGVPLLGTATIFQLYRTLQARGLGGEGNHALYKALAALAGASPRPARDHEQNGPADGES
jgi:3-hydroxyisobutyrate dehydrogenase-like beta-hydroxyacid dehydrogenase